MAISTGTLLAQFVCGFSLCTLHHSVVFSAVCGIVFEVAFTHAIDIPLRLMSILFILAGVASGFVHVNLTRTKRFHPTIEAMNRNAMIKRVVWELLLLLACRYSADTVAGPFAFPVGIVNGAVRFLGCAILLFLDSGDVKDMIQTWSDYDSYCTAHFLWILNCLLMYTVAFCFSNLPLLAFAAIAVVPVLVHAVAVRVRRRWMVTRSRRCPTLHPHGTAGL